MRQHHINVNKLYRDVTQMFILVILSFVVKTAVLPPEVTRVELEFPLVQSIKVVDSKGQLIPFSTVACTLFVDTHKDTLYVEYFSLELPDSFSLGLMEKSDSPSRYVEREEKKPYIGLKIRGVKTLSIGYEEGVSMNQSSEIKISGSVGRGIEVEGILSDKNMGPYGFEVTPSELEELYIRASSSKFSAVLGSYLKTLNGRELHLRGANLVTTFQGKRIEFLYGKTGGAWSRYSFRPEAGLLGPYRIHPEGVEDEVRIVPGTEKVFLNGKKLRRGEDGDYLIDYERGEIMFNPGLEFSASDVVMVDFEYTTDFISRDVKGVFVRDSSLEIDYVEFSPSIEELKSRLGPAESHLYSELGDSIALLREGVFYVGEGRGDYILEGGHYRYVGPGAGNYMVFFTYAGEGLGDYSYNDTLGGYLYVGDGGDFRIARRPLDLTGLKLGSLGYKIKRGGFIGEIEVDFSDVDMNVLSYRDDEDNKKAGYSIKTGWDDGRIELVYERREFPEGLRTLKRPLGIDPFHTWGLYPDEGSGLSYNGFVFNFKRREFRLGTKIGSLLAGDTAVFMREIKAEWEGPLEVSGFIRRLNKFPGGEMGTGELIFRLPSPYFDVLYGISSKKLGWSFSEDIWVSLERAGSPKISLKLNRRREGREKLTILALNSVLRRGGAIVKASHTGIYKHGKFQNTGRLTFNVTRGGYSFELKSALLKEMGEGKNYVYRFVGRGRGNYEFDETTGTFYEDPFGSYVRESLNYPSSGSLEFLNFGFNFERVGDLTIRINMEERRGFKGWNSLETPLILLRRGDAILSFENERRDWIFEINRNSEFNKLGEEFEEEKLVAKFELLERTLKGIKVGPGASYSYFDGTSMHFMKRTEFSYFMKFKKRFNWLSVGLREVRLKENYGGVLRVDFIKTVASFNLWKNQVRGELEIMRGTAESPAYLPDIPNGFGVKYRIFAVRKITKKSRLNLFFVGRDGALPKRSRFNVTMEFFF